MEYSAIEIIPHMMGCTRELYNHSENITGPEQWLFTANDVLYFTFPGILAVALFFTLLNSVITCRLVTDSHECYIAGFNVASFVMMLIYSIIHLPNYIEMKPASIYVRMLPYLPAVENWCWYTCSWLLVTATAERLGHAVFGHWHSSFGRVHGILASMLIVVVCFVSSLPQYWEYRATTMLVPHEMHNCSKLVVGPRAKLLTADGDLISEYKYYHWFLLALGIALPYLLLPIMIPGMCCVKMSAYSSINTANKFAVTLKDHVVDERNFNRMLAVKVTLYLFLGAPRNVLKLLEKSPINYKICNDQLLMITLSVLFELLFCFFFIILFLLYCCFGNKFKCTLKRICCCCKSDEDDDYMY